MDVSEANAASSGAARDDHAQLDHDVASGPRGDQAMTDDMRLAISALGLLRSEGATAGGDNEAPSDSLTARPRPSTSTASTSTASDAWGTGSSSSTLLQSSGASSPLTTTSIAPSDVGPQADHSDRTGGSDDVEGDAKFIERVSQLPLVSGGLEWYERSKASSRVVKFGAGLVESSFSAVSRPITNNLQMGPLDDFACRQLDRIGAPHRSPGRRDGDELKHDPEEALARDRTPPSHPRPEDDYTEPHEASPGNQVAVHNGQRSRWQTVLVEAGGLGAAVSEESLKSLRYCLQWLIYATAHLDHQIATLRDFILSLRAHNRSHPSGAANSSSSANRDPPNSTALVAASASAHLAQIKHDVVETIRKVVEVVSKYAGAALPEQAKRYVKQSIMGLPVKWASAIESRGTTSASMDRQGSENGTATVQRMSDAYFTNRGGQNGASAMSEDEAATREARERDRAEAEARAALGPTEEAADRVLTFAVESLDMLRSVANIFGESVEKAEAWIERLRIVGLQRQRQRREQEHEQQEHGHNFSIAAPADETPTSSSSSPAPMAWSTSTASASDSNVTSGGGMKRRRGVGSVAESSESSGHQIGDSSARSVTMDECEDFAASARRKRGARSREMSAQLSLS